MSKQLNPQPISIWQPRIDKSGRIEFVRPPSRPLGDHYAERRIISMDKPGDSMRICFFGESAAAGYLFAPHVTPAKVLEHHLNTADQSSRYEVIDLARTNERIETLVTTVERSLQLQPDKLVVFTGNNWHLLETPEISPYYPSISGRQALAAALKRDWWGPLDIAAEQLINRVGQAFEYMHALAEKAGIPLIIVVPEVNLADWETRQPAPWLPDGQIKRWYSLYHQAGEAIKLERWEDLLEVADQMLILDGERSPTSWRLMAIARQGLGMQPEARLAAELSINTTQYPTLGFLAAPQISVVGQEILRRVANHFQLGCVDLPHLLAEITDNRLPGTAHFADYCHLNQEGMHVCMGFVAAKLLGISPADLLPLLTRRPLAAEALATARLGAAMHTAHRQLQVSPHNEIVKYWCEKAIEASPEIVKAMVDLVEARCAPIPAIFTHAQQRNISGTFNLMLQHGWRYNHLDAPLIEAILVSLETHAPALNAQLFDKLIKIHGIGTEPIDLLKDRFYLWEPLARFYPEVGSFADVQASAIFRAAWPVTTLALVSAGQADLNLSITARLPKGASDKKIVSRSATISVNGFDVDQIHLSDEWQLLTLTIPKKYLQYGLNKLRIDWFTRLNVDGMADALMRLERGEETDLYPVFGELFSVKLRL